MIQGFFNDVSAVPGRDVYARVTNTVLAQLAKGVAPWVQPWKAAHPEGRITRPLRHNGLRYTGVNVLLLWASAIEQGFSSPSWMTFRQALELGAHVRKGEHGSVVVYADRMVKRERNDKGDEIEKEVGYLKTYRVFNVEQIEGLPAQYRGPPPQRFENQVLRLENAETFLRGTGARIVTRGAKALYSAKSDHILLPPIESFFNAESYYGTAAHELIHWSKHPTRLAREFGRKTWGDEAYAAEELVAEMGSAFLCADLEITPEVSERHAAYMATWLRVLLDDKRAIVQAASYAQKAVDYLHSLQPKPITADTETTIPTAPLEPNEPGPT